MNKSHNDIENGIEALKIFAAQIDKNDLLKQTIFEILIEELLNYNIEKKE